MSIAVAETDEQIVGTYEVMHQLRPHLQASGYLAAIRALEASDGFRLAALSDDGEVRAVAGYRVMNMLCCGRILYVDDLVTDARVRSRGYGRRLLGWLREEGKRLGCNDIQLISRVTREEAHRFYFREGMSIMCFHFRAEIDA
jgi:GNAT superfamily N-acetyltransferase